jgi:hypothetical protein
LDLMWHRVLMRMQRRRTTRSSGASTGLAGVGSWTSGRGSTAVARSLQCERKSESDGSESDCDGGRRRRMGSTPPQVSLFIGGVHRIYPLRLLPPYNKPQWLYPEKFARRLRRMFHKQTTATT